MPTLYERIRKIREEKRLSQADVERTTGLRRQYLSRVENGRTMPSIETLEKLAGALRVPLYRLFYDGAKPISAFKGWTKPKATTRTIMAHDSGTMQLLRLVCKLKDSDRRLLLAAAQKLVQLQRAA